MTAAKAEFGSGGNALLASVSSSDNHFFQAHEGYCLLKHDIRPDMILLREVGFGIFALMFYFLL
jgi:hypothetical protein